MTSYKVRASQWVTHLVYSEIYNYLFIVHYVTCQDLKITNRSSTSHSYVAMQINKIRHILNINIVIWSIEKQLIIVSYFKFSGNKFGRCFLHCFRQYHNWFLGCDSFLQSTHGTPRCCNRRWNKWSIFHSGSTYFWQAIGRSAGMINQFLYHHNDLTEYQELPVNYW